MYSATQQLGNTDVFSSYVSNMYDSSADYWKMLNDGTLESDGSGWLRDDKGNFILNKDGQMIGAGGIETGWLNIIYGGTSNNSYKAFDDNVKAKITVKERLKNAEIVECYAYENNTGV